MVFTISKNMVITRSCEEPKVWKQFCLSFLASLPFFTHGVETTALSTSAHSGHFITTSGVVPWSTTAMVIAGAVTAPVFSYVIDKWGRKSGVYVVNLVQGASCIPLFLPQTEASVIILHVLAGISSAGLFTVLPTYIREISNFIRALSISLMMVMTTAGYLMELVINLEAMMFLMVALVAAQFLALLLIVESPSYLVKVGKMDVAKKTISHITCLSEDNPNVAKELSALKEESDRSKVSGKIKLLGILRSPINRDATKIGVTLYTSLVLCGNIVFMDEEKVLMQLKMTLAMEKALVLSCMFAGSLLCLCVIHFVERKHLLAFGFVVMVLSMGLLSVYTQAHLTVYSLRQLPVAALGVLVGAFGLCWGLPYVIMAEIYNIETRATMLAVLFTYSQILKLIHVHTFQYIEDYMGLYTILYIFAGINIFAGVYAMFAIPDLKGKTVRQIEKQLKRVPLIKFNTIKA